MKLGSGKLVFRPSQGPFALLEMIGEPRTVGSRDRVRATHVEGEVNKEDSMLIS
jgi:hypothetical protein